MEKIRLLDLCCGGGACAKGYKDAADELGIEIEIVGVDIDPKSNYPFEFVQGDAMEFLKKNGNYFNRIHASPPCQKYSRSTAPHRKYNEYSDLLEHLKPALIEVGIPSVIENVPGAPIRKDVVLRGDMFGLKTLKRRWFQLDNWFMMKPLIPKQIGTVRDGDFASIFGKGGYRKSSGDAYPKFMKGSIKATWGYAMGIDWMKTEEMSQAVPPAYTHYIGLRFFSFPNPY